ncbi:MAG: hypothetical protein M3122_06990, partial [Actinomycetota bacterium]|nr:hypothetical protein [Actinomycetota bacterium]
MHQRILTRSRALTALLLFMLLVLPACGGDTNTTSQSKGQETTAAEEIAQGEAESTEQWTTVESVNPEDILSEEQRTGP